MRRASNDSADSARIVLGLLDAVEKDRAQSQRLLASELGIALGLVNAYLRRCVKKGLVKVSEAPARRFAYYLTPQGFAEKSRLTVEYLSYSFSFFRQAKADCANLLQSAKAGGIKKLILAGQSDLAEIAALCAIEHGIEIVGVVQDEPSRDQFIGLPVFANFDDGSVAFDAVMITDLVTPQETSDVVLARFDASLVLIPAMLRIRIKRPSEATP